MSGATHPQTGKGTGTFRRSKAPTPGGSADPLEQAQASYRLNHADNIPHIAPGEHEAQHKASCRAWECLILATTPEGWGALLRGEPLPHDQLDQHNLQRAQRRQRG